MLLKIIKNHAIMFYRKNIYTLNYKKGVTCPIDSTSGTIMLLGQTGTGLEKVNDTYLKVNN